MILTCNPLRAVAMTYTHTQKFHGRQSVGSENRADNKQTDGRTEAIALPPSATSLVRSAKRTERDVDDGRSNASRSVITACVAAVLRTSTCRVAQSVRTSTDPRRTTRPSASATVLCADRRGEDAPRQSSSSSIHREPTNTVNCNRG